MPLMCCHLFAVGIGGLRTSLTRIAMLALVFIFLVGFSQVRWVEEVRRFSSTVLSFFLSIYLFFSSLFFLTLWFSRPYIIFFRCSGVKPFHPLIFMFHFIAFIFHVSYIFSFSFFTGHIPSLIQINKKGGFLASYFLDMYVNSHYLLLPYKQLNH